MTDDEIADAFKAAFDAAHASLDAKPDDDFKRRATRYLKLMHGAADGLKELSVEAGLIMPRSGGDPKPPMG